MRIKIFTALGAGLLVTSLAACGSNSKAGDSGSTGGGGVGKIAVLLPNCRSSPRWETADRVFFEQTFKKAGLTPDDYIISNPEGDPAVQRHRPDPGNHRRCQGPVAGEPR